MSQFETPLYQQIYDELKSAIDSGQYAPGDKIPSEAELSSKYAVSRITVRRAIEDLCAAGFLIKRRGLGTFVCEPRMRRKLLQGGLPQSFTDICLQSGRVPGAKLINREIAVARRDEYEFFGLDKSGLILHVQRLRTADDLPVFEENMYMPLVGNEELASCELQGNSLYELIEELYGKKPVKNSKILVEAVGASGERASRLQVPVSEPLLYITTYALDQHEEPVYIGRQYFIGSRYMLDL